jgi:hypothetical protein
MRAIEAGVTQGRVEPDSSNNVPRLEIILSRQTEARTHDQHTSNGIVDCPWHCRILCPTL